MRALGTLCFLSSRGHRPAYLYEYSAPPCGESRPREIVSAMSMAGGLHVQSVTRGPVCYVRVAGTVDESFDPGVLLSEISGKKIILNLRAVNRLTSFGVREWTNAMRELGRKAERVFFVECSPAFVNQLNMVSNFAGSARVLSVQAPFHCDACGWDYEVTCEIRGDEAASLPRPACEKCGQPMEFDDDPNSYFKFPEENRPENTIIEQSVEGVIRHFSQNIEFSSESAPEAEQTVINVLNAAESRRPSEVTPPPAVQNASSSTRDLNLRRVPLSVVVFGLLTLGTAIGLTALLLSKGPSKAELAEHMKQERYQQAALGIAEMERRGELTPDQARTEREHLVEQALRRFEELDKSDRRDDAEKIVLQLEREEALPLEDRSRFNERVAKRREGRAERYRRESLSHFEKKHYEEAIASAARAEQVAPLDIETLFAMAESNRLLGRPDQASIYYGRFLSQVEGQTPPHPRLDDALFWWATRLREIGKEAEAKQLFKRVLDLGGTEFRTAAERMLAR